MELSFGDIGIGEVSRRSSIARPLLPVGFVPSPSYLTRDPALCSDFCKPSIGQAQVTWRSW